jgi:hypothetical protein
VPERPLTRREIAELADRLRGLIAIIEADEMSATTAMTYRLQGAVTALDAVLGHSTLPLGWLDQMARTRSEGSKSPTPR